MENLLDKKFCELNNRETMYYFDTEGSFPVLILIHGNMSSSLFYDSLINKLKSNFRVIAVDMRGFGHSSYINPINSLFDLAEDIKLLISKLNIQRCSLLGWSTGGGVSLCFSILYPEIIHKIILMGSVGLSGFPVYKLGPNGKPSKERIKAKSEIFEDKYSKMFDQALKEKNLKFIDYCFDNSVFSIKKLESKRNESYLNEVILQRNFIDIMYSLSTFNLMDFEALKGKLKSEILVIHGEFDKVIPVKEALMLNQYLGNLSNLIIYKNCGHSPFIDCEDILIKDIKSFLINKTKF